MVSRRQSPLSPPPPLGHAVPQNIHHAISVQMTTWADMQGLMLRSERILKVQKIGYPRSFLHEDVVRLHKTILSAAAVDGACLAFPSWRHATACINLIVRRNPDITTFPAVLKIQFRVRGIDSEICLYAVIYPLEYHNAALEFWRLTGTGISSRFAEAVLRDFETVTVTGVVDGIQEQVVPWARPGQDEPSAVIRARICHLLKRAALSPEINNELSPTDVYLYPTGMSAIYHCNRMLNERHEGESIVFGFLYELTPKLLQLYSQSFHFFGFGTERELEELETRLATAVANNNPVPAVWCECPSNPLLHTVNFARLRSLADRYGFLLIVDETIGTFANVDLLPFADVLVTSLTKAFSGNADVMGGSIVLNPSAPFYQDLKRIMESTYVPELHPLDAEVLEYNSRAFLSRVNTMNQNTYNLITLLTAYASTPNSVITKIFHPSILPSRENYDVCMRCSTADFSPGHGGLFTIEFESEKAASIFFNNLDIHKGPSLGACVTLAQPYVQTVFAREKAWAASYGLSDTIVRISVGLEDPVSLSRAFRRAFGIANWAKKGCDYKSQDMSLAEWP